MFRQLSATSDRHIPGLAKLATTVHKYGSKIFIQLHHPGREGVSALIGGQPCVSASDRMCNVSKQETRPMTLDEIHELVGQFGDAALRCKKAGIDGIELHCAHGYLLQQFLSPYTNKRTDEYGGTFENRMRIVLEIIEDIANRTNFIKEKVDEMVEARKVANKIESEREKAIAYHDKIVPMLEAIRYHIDKLELVVDDQIWTLPKYRELLFIR